MDLELDRSVRLLEDAFSPRGEFHKRQSKSDTKRMGDQFDLSLTLAPHELKKFMLHGGDTIYDETLTTVLQTDRTFVGNTQLDRTSWKTAIDQLRYEFFSIFQNYFGGSSGTILDVISELGCCCSDTLKAVQKSKVTVVDAALEEEIWLEKERNTWRLLFILYQDRFLSQNENDNGNYFGPSEKLCVESLFKKESLVRETQLVIDWLEYNSAEKDDDVLTFSDSNVGWENTLHQLQFAENIAFGCSRPIVVHMDPDAPHYERKPLHDLDTEDEKRLSKKIFSAIRAGKLEEAQKLCRQCGHSWRAAILEGWRLFHDPYVQENNEQNSQQLEPMEIIGNYNRDIWKSMAIKFSKQEYLDPYDRATIGSLCGLINSILPVCQTWNDYLWAYMKCLVDIRVESEIRDCCIRRKQYIPLPDEYWTQRMSLNEIFLALESSKNSFVRKESLRLEHVVQKYIILDEIPSLLRELEDSVENANLPVHYLRFIAHLVLFLDQIGQGYDRQIIEKVLEAYIKKLMEFDEAELIPFYISKLNPTTQVTLYSQYLQKIEQYEERKQSLIYAENNGLNILSITRQVVENVRKLPVEFEATMGLQQKLTDSDKRKISALDWLNFYDYQKAESLIQTNGLIFTFLTMGKLEAAQLALNKVSSNTVEILLSEEKISEEVNQAIKEYFSYKVYIDANEAFNEWFKQSKNCPSPPDELPDNAEFSEKVAYQHRVSQYKADLERWKLTTAHLAKTAKTLLYNVLLFPEGWLVDTKNADCLRTLCIPEAIMLLYSILSESGDHGEAVQLADVIASEKQCIYKLYSKEKLEEILTNLCESSVALLNVNKDPWGNETSV